MNRTLVLFSLLLLTTGCAVELTLPQSEMNLWTGESVVVEAVQPGNTMTRSDLVPTKWSSSDEAVVTVTRDEEEWRFATLEAIGPGTATVEVVEGGDPAVMTVTVTAGALLTIAVDPGAFQLVEAQVNGVTLGQEGYSAVLDEYAYFVDKGDSASVMAAEGVVDFSFMSPSSFALDQQRYRLVTPIVMADRIDQTYTFLGQDGEYEEVP